jgi:chromosome segregation ATPase
MIEKEKEKIDILKNNFMKNYQDKVLFNDEQSQKFAQSVQLNEEDTKEKNELKKQLDKYKTQNDKLKQEIKKLKKSIEELEKSKYEIDLELDNSKKDKKTFLEMQIKDSKKIAALNKDKEKLKKENNKIKDDLEKLRQRLNDIEQDNERLSNLNNNLEYQLKNKASGIGSISSKIEGMKIDTKNKITELNQQKQNQFSVQASKTMINIDEVLNNLCNYCINKNINLKKHLLRYDINKNGKIGLRDFKRAIEELKIGFINYDLEKLANTVKLPNRDDISIENFLNILKNKSPEFKQFLDEFPDENAIFIKRDDKQLSRKYDNFAGKEFNIDY